MAATWFESLPIGSVDNWEELVEAYMSRFFPPTLPSERRREIIVFKKREDESLYNAWERYKRLLKICLMHGIDLTTQMDIFYHAMNYTSKGIINVACCGTFNRKNAEEAKVLCRTINSSMLHMGSKDSSNRVARELRIRAKGGLNLLRSRC